MFKYFSRNWGWYVAAVMLFGPHLLFFVINDDVLVRVISIGAIYVLPVPILIYALLASNNYDTIVPTGWLESKVSKNKLYVGTKIFLIALTFYWVLAITSSYISDLKLIASGEAPLAIETVVSSIDVETGALSLKLRFNESPFQLQAYYFPRNTFEEGYRYKLIYLPNTKRVIDAELISTNVQE